MISEGPKFVAPDFERELPPGASFATMASVDVSQQAYEARLGMQKDEVLKNTQVMQERMNGMTQHLADKQDSETRVTEVHVVFHCCCQF